MRTARTAALPLFYTQVIGSLPRPAAVRDLPARREALPAAEFRAAMDDITAFAIRLQETAGLDVEFAYQGTGQVEKTFYVAFLISEIRVIGGFKTISSGFLVQYRHDRTIAPGAGDGCGGHAAPDQPFRRAGRDASARASRAL
jgi:methionine synthase II (cobalamin-independent)